MQSRYRYLRGSIPRAWDCIGSWEARKEHQNRAPMTVDILQYMCTVAFSWSIEREDLASRMLPIAVLLRLAFFGLLRPGELFKLKAEDISISEDMRGAKSVVIALTAPKTRLFMGRNQFAIVTDKPTVCG